MQVGGGNHLMWWEEHMVWRDQAGLTDSRRIMVFGSVELKRA